MGRDAPQYTYMHECMYMRHNSPIDSYVFSLAMARKTKAEAEETRQQILDAAEQVFGCQGVARTSLQEIAQAAGLTRGAVYWHFENKAALFQAMMDRVIMPCEGAITELEMAPEQNTLALLSDLALSPLHELASKPQVQRVFTIAMHLTEYTGELASQLDQHRQGIQRYIGQLETLLARAQAKQQLAAHIQARAAALGLFSLVDGLMYHWTLAPDSFDLMDVGGRTISTFISGLACSTA
jgi:TetR/AcrR family acrAB operon transcriptional repressor